MQVVIAHLRFVDLFPDADFSSSALQSGSPLRDLSFPIARFSNAAREPTDFLYCTAVRFIEGGRCLAYCLVSRHPFVEAFGQLLVMLHDGEEVLEDVGEAGPLQMKMLPLGIL
eukprot:s3852_g16.t1